ncbi:recombinase family protein [Sphingomonas populi]|uniref:Recombinase family protein n=1 Tax=Sphingomonas populi TaxID=2484750 RepID=A0A4Q6XGI2_9SPHN|nr:recombinase family protein [Sphingomonas populi]RZF59020.1 recombinase family protein [Sphingomonas populi]
MRTINYLRVSTERQGRSGLGLEAQRASIEAFCATRQCEPLATYTEIESGKRDDRPELIKALHHAKVTGATLVIAKLDRLSRNAAFLMTLKDAGVRFICADMPDANNLTIGIMALIAQQEREATSTRTKEALQAAKARGTKLGNPNGAAALRRASKGNTAALTTITGNADAHALDLAPVIADVRSTGITSLSGIATALNARTIRTPRGGKWHATSVKNLLARIA